MKLTKCIRDAFVRSALNDVPQVDYAEQIRSRVNNLAAGYRQAAGLPKDDEDGRLRVSNFHAGCVWVQAFGLSHDEVEAIKRDSQIMMWQDQSHAQQERLDALRSSLRGVAYSVTTRKALADALPEFVKYLPADEAAASRTVPAIANVVAEFAAAGWPKP